MNRLLVKRRWEAFIAIGQNGPTISTGCCLVCLLARTLPAGTVPVTAKSYHFDTVCSQVFSSVSYNGFSHVLGWLCITFYLKRISFTLPRLNTVVGFATSAQPARSVFGITCNPGSAAHTMRVPREGEAECGNSTWHTDQQWMFHHAAA